MIWPNVVWPVATIVGASGIMLGILERLWLLAGISSLVFVLGLAVSLFIIRIQAVSDSIHQSRQQ